MDLSSLRPLFDRPGPWASVYMDTSHNTEDAARRHELRVRAAVAELAEQGAEKRTCEAVRRALADVPVSGEPPARALFACDGEVVLDQPLATAPVLPEATWAPLPRLGPLVALSDDGPSCLIAHIDRTGARLELDDGRRRIPQGEVEGEQWPVHRTGRNEWSERHFQLKVENTWEQNAELIAGEIAKRCQATGARLVVLAGDPRERRLVLEHLPEQLRGLAVETGRDPSEEKIAQLRKERQEQRLAAVLDRFRAARGRPGEHGAGGGQPGPAAEGVPAVVSAAQRRQVEALLVQPGSPDPARTVWIGPSPDQVAVDRKELESLGVSRPQAARADDALVRSAVAANAEVFAVPEDSREPAGGIGAVLRWSNEPAFA